MSAAFITFGGSKAWCGDLVSLDGTKMRAVASANDIAGAARLTRDIRSYRDEIAIISIGSTSWTIVCGAPWSLEAEAIACVAEGSTMSVIVTEDMVPQQFRRLGFCGARNRMTGRLQAASPQHRSPSRVSEG
ncbi:hypothetical protein [Sphingopyxis sp. MSC1_008]|jgi:hypothetical protein|uniref:hypothetical protein n=1 Tax=Sphingopyxis sp. MSC1_008 TaxID=2909265 RepID=UPI0020BE0236|nr:hypothetical protein [Sphingopyxis sp. MSC1_008]